MKTKHFIYKVAINLYLSITAITTSLNASQNPTEPLCTLAWSNFGELSDAYAAGRHEHPIAAFDLLKKYVNENALTGDLGSGTGISTRQLVAQGFTNVIGLDRDELMLQHALAVNTPEVSINYVKGDVTNGLPFADGELELVTAFSAIHWFADPASIKEIGRIIKSKGYFFSVKGSGGSSGTIKVYTTKLIEDSIGSQIPSKQVDPAALFKAIGFKVIVNEEVPYIEYYTKQQALDNMQSNSMWNFIKDSPYKNEVLAKLNAYLDTLVNAQGLIKQEGKAKVVLVQKL